MKAAETNGREWREARSLKRCGHGGCTRRCTHQGFIGATVLISGCEWHVRRWAKFGSACPIKGVAR